jgi:hypothetical protein
MSLLCNVANARLLSVVAFDFLHELLFVGLVNDITEVRLEWIVCAEHEIRKCDLELLLVLFGE